MKEIINLKPKPIVIFFISFFPILLCFMTWIAYANITSYSNVDKQLKVLKPVIEQKIEILPKIQESFDILTEEQKNIRLEIKQLNKLEILPETQKRLVSLEEEQKAIKLKIEEIDKKNSNDHISILTSLQEINNKLEKNAK